MKESKKLLRETLSKKRGLLLMFFRQRAEVALVDCTAENNNTALK